MHVRKDIITRQMLEEHVGASLRATAIASHENLTLLCLILFTFLTSSLSISAPHLTNQGFHQSVNYFVRWMYVLALYGASVNCTGNSLRDEHMYVPVLYGVSVNFAGNSLHDNAHTGSICKLPGF